MKKPKTPVDLDLEIYEDFSGLEVAITGDNVIRPMTFQQAHHRALALSKFFNNLAEWCRLNYHKDPRLNK